MIKMAPAQEKSVLTVQTSHRKAIQALVVTPDAQKMITAGQDNTLRIWDVATGRLLDILRGHKGDIRSLAISKDGKYVASGSTDRTIRLWDTHDWKELKVLTGHTRGITALAFRDAGDFLISVSQDQTIRTWDLGENLGSESMFAQGDVPYTSVVISPNGQDILAGRNDGKVEFWNYSSKRLIKLQEGAKYPISCLRYAQNLPMYLVAGGDRFIEKGEVLVYREDSISSNVSVGPLQAEVYSAAFSPDASELVSGGGNEVNTELKLWAVSNRVLIREFLGHRYRVRDVAFLPDGNTIISVGGANKLDSSEICIWKTQKEKVQNYIYPFLAPVLDFATSPGQDLLATAHGDGILRVWDLKNAHLLYTQKGHEKAVQCISFSPDGNFLISSSEDGKTIFWEAKTGKKRKTLEDSYPSFKHLFNPRDKSLLVARVSDIAQYDPNNAQLLGKIKEAHSLFIYAMCLDKNGLRLFTGGYDGDIKLWSSAGKLLRTFPGQRGKIYDLALSKDEQVLVAASADKHLYFYNPANGQLFRRIMAHETEIRATACASKGKWVASGASNGEVKLWDRNTGKLVHQFSGHEEAISSLAFSPDDQYLISSGEEGSLRVWDVNNRSLHLTFAAWGEKNSEYIIADAEGTYKKSKSGEQALHFVKEGGGVLLLDPQKESSDSIQNKTTWQ